MRTSWHVPFVVDSPGRTVISFCFRSPSSGCDSPDRWDSTLVNRSVVGVSWGAGCWVHTRNGGSRGQARTSLRELVAGLSLPWSKPPGFRGVGHAELRRQARPESECGHRSWLVRGVLAPAPWPPRKILYPAGH